MSFFEEWIRAGKIPPSELSREALDGIDRWDRQDEARVAKEVRDYRLAGDALCDVAPTGGALWRDAFFAFHKATIKLHDEGAMRPTHLINRKVIAELSELPDVERLRSWTVADLLASSQAAISIEEDLETLYDRARQRDIEERAAQMERRMQQIAAAEAGIRDTEEMVNAWAAANPDDLTDEELAERNQALQALINQAKQDLGEMEGEAEGAAGELDQMTNDIVGGAVAGMRASLAAQADEMDAFASAAQGWGLDPGQLRKMDPKTRLELAERLRNPKLAAVAELWGPMSRIAMTEQTRKVYHSFEEVYDISYGNDLARILSSELLLLDDETMEVEFFRRYCDHQLAQYEMRGEEKVGKGGIILCDDNSGSMMGEKEVWAKAVGLAAMDIARTQKRSFYGIHFGSSSELSAWDFRDPTAVDVEKVLGYAEEFFAGGTDFMTPLQAAVDLLEEEFEQAGWVSGDIVFVTDGMCGVSDEWLRAFKETQERIGFKVWGIAIGCPRNSEPLSSICDGQVITISDLLSGEEIREMFQAL